MIKVLFMSSRTIKSIKSIAWVSCVFLKQTNINLYETARPTYTKESVECLLDKLEALNDTTKPLTILELGAGTGKFTRVLVDVLKKVPRSNVRIIASDPQASMCEKFKNVVPGVKILNCKAENIPLPDTSVDLVVAAQAFHWFANAEALTEIHRVLVLKGKIGAIWNTRDRWNVDWVDKIEDIVKSYYAKYHYPGGFSICAPAINESKLFTTVEEKADLCNTLGPITADDIIEMYMSISSIHKSTLDEKKNTEIKIRDVLANHPDLKGNTSFVLPYVVHPLWCTKI